MWEMNGNKHHSYISFVWTQCSPIPKLQRCVHFYIIYVWHPTSKHKVTQKGIHAILFRLPRSSVMIRGNFPAEWPSHVTGYILCAAMFTVNLNLFPCSASLCHVKIKCRFSSFTHTKKSLDVLSSFMIRFKAFSPEINVFFFVFYFQY